MNLNRVDVVSIEVELDTEEMRLIRRAFIEFCKRRYWFK